MTSASPANQFDLGPLTWVKSEIDLALDRATQAIKQFAGNPQDSTQIKFCRTHLHQVRGALAIVGLDGVTHYADALEHLLADIEEGRQPSDSARVALIGAAILEVRKYLDDIVAGEPNQPLRLLPAYRHLTVARGLPAPSGSELFFPDITIRPALRPIAPQPPGSGAQKLRNARARFQKGLLAWLRAPNQPGGAQELQLSAVEIGNADESPIVRAFWWVASGLFAAVAERKIGDEAQIKHLLPRIDQQIRRQFEGSRTVPERLMRDVLFAVALCTSDRAVVREIRRTYGLDELIPAAPTGGAQAAQIEPLIKRLREITTGAEEAWSKFCGGTAGALATFRDASAALHQGSDRIGHTDFRRLTQAVAAIASWVAENPSRQNDSVSLEVATAILVVANALDGFSHLGPDFVHQVDVMVARLHACIAGNPPPADAELPALDEMSRRAQERLLIAQVVREILSNLGQVEQALDTFFRDTAQREALANLKGPLHQIEGALTILGQDAAVRALRNSISSVGRFAAAEYVPEKADFEAVANQLSALGFFVESLQSGSGDFDEFMRRLEQGPGVRRPAAEDQFSATEEAPKGVPPPPDAVVARAPVTPPAAPSAPVAPAADTMPAGDDATDEFTRTTVLTAQDLSPPAPEPTPAVDEAPMFEPLDIGEPPSPPPVAPPPPAAEPPAPAAPAPEVHATTEEIDAELLEIFLEEAGEVLQTIADNLETLRANPADADALTTVRRAFHTLKGSSRMVGLKDFGEVAWAIEQVHNQWLRQELKVNGDLLDLIATSQSVFGEWVSHLASGDGEIPETAALVAHAERLRGIEAAPAPVAAPAAEAPAPEAPVEEGGAAGDADLAAESETDLAATAADEPPAMPEAPIELEAVAETAATDLEITIASEPEPANAAEAPFAFDEAAAEAAESAPPMDVGEALEPTELAFAGEAPAVEDVASIDFDSLGADLEALEKPASDAGEAELAPDIEVSAVAESVVETPAGTETLLETIGEAAAEDQPVTVDAPEVHEVPEVSFDLETADASDDSKSADIIDLSTVREDAAPDDATIAAAPEAPEDAAPQQTITMSPVLQEIFLEEAQQHLASLQHYFGQLELSPGAPTSIDMVRAAHTLGSIAGTVGYPTIKQLGHALEDALIRRSNASQRDSYEALEVIRQTIAELEQMVGALLAGEAPSDHTTLITTLAELYPLSGEATPDAAPEAALLSPLPVAPELAEPLPDDHLDESLLPIFLEEANDLVAGLGERFSMWRNQPGDTDSIHALERLLHTLKGSARMAGAMRVGALTHRLESRIERAHKAGGADGAQIDDLQLAFDEIALLIEDLQAAPAEAEPPADEPAFETAQIIDFAARTPPQVAEAPAESAPSAPPAPAEPIPADHLDEQLLPIFLEEATELTQAVYEHLDTLRANPADGQAAHGLARALHTIKGSARMAGAMSLGYLTHTLETRIEDASRAGAPDVALIDEIRGTFDTIAGVIEQLQRGEPLGGPEPVVPEPVITVDGSGAAPADEARPEPAGPVDAQAAEAPAGPAPEVAAVPKARDEGAPKPMLRVRAEMIDHLVNDAGELSIARTRIEGEMRNLKQSLLDLTENVIRLRRQLREIEIQAESQMQSKIALTSDSAMQFDPLELDRFTRFQELTRMMAESVNDVATVQQNLLKNLDEANAGLLAQSRLNRELQQQLMAVRMVPFASITERLYRIVRQTAKELGKRTDLEIKGSQIELDQNVINKMIGPFEHLLRNAIAHGIEAPDVRRGAGKDEMGEIVLTLRQEGNEVVITMRDDGGGLHYDKIRAKAVANGLLGADEPADERRLAEMIFQSGFSTATQVTQVSGRGVGMDVVKTEVASLGGRIDVSSEAGRGSVFRIFLPLTLAVTNAVLVRIAGTTYAIPASMVEQVQEIREDALAQIRDAGGMDWQGNPYPFHFLPHLLGETDATPEARKLYWLLLLHSGAQRIAIQVDELQRSQEIVVKNIGPQLARVVGVTGATVLGDGRVVLILNPVVLAARADRLAATAVTRPEAAAPVAEPAPVAAAPAALPTVFVVDDSLTVRKITGRLLSREGYQVVTAKDGVDALEQLTELNPDVIISDIEMPRMDGFELARNIRGNERLKGIPIIMITSRTAEKHRSHAIEIGVNDYLGKPYQEEELLGLVAGYVAQRRGGH